MALETKLITKFGGLNLASGLLDAGLDYAVDSVNMDYSTLGAIQTRGGWFKLTAVASGQQIRHILYRRAADRFVAIGAGEINQYAHSTGVISVPLGAGSPWVASTVAPPAQFGLPTGERYVFVPSTNFGVGVQYRRLEDNPLPNTVTTGILAAKPQFMAVYPGQNRMAYAGFFAAADAPGGANGGPSVIFFSDANAPEVVGATHFQVLDPGDGDNFAGVVGWENQLFVFKNRTLYTFFGVSPDDDGEPLFDYKAWPLPDPIPATGGNFGIVPIAAGPDGVYFMGSQGLWKTTGGHPTRVVTPIDQFFSSEADPSGVSGIYRQFVRGDVVMGWVGDRLFINYNAKSPFGPRTMIWNKTFNVWTSWEITTNTMTAIPVSVNDGIYSAGVLASGQHMWKQIVSGLDADGQNVLWRYKTGFSDFGFAGEKRLRYVDVFGQGLIAPTVNAVGRRNTGLVAATGSAISVGATNLSDRQRYFLPLNGRNLQLQFDNSSGSANRSVIERVELRYSGGSPV